MLDEELDRAVAQMPAPTLDPAFAAQVQRAARLEFSRRPVSGLRGLLGLFEPVLLCSAAAAHTVGVVITLVHVFG